MTEQVERLARQAARRTLDPGPLGYKIDRFGRHPDGFFQAHVIASSGLGYYLTTRFGSWLAPGEQQGRAVLKEPESLGLPFEMKVELQERAHAIEKAERKEATEDESTGDDTAAVGEIPAPDLRQGED